MTPGTEKESDGHQESAVESSVAPCRGSGDGGRSGIHDWP